MSTLKPKRDENHPKVIHPHLNQVIQKEQVLTEKVYVWELPIRIFHWINALCILILFVTGVYIGNPFFSPIRHDEPYYLFVMGWVRDIHFITAFIFTINLVVRAYWTWKGNTFARSRPYTSAFWKGLYQTLRNYLFLKNKKEDYIGHNPLAEASYWVFIGLGSLIMVFTGFYLFVEPQLNSVFGKLFSWVPFVFGGSSFSVRGWHHYVAWGFIAFIILHVYLSIREDWLSQNGTMSSIFTGFKEIKKADNRNEGDE